MTDLAALVSDNLGIWTSAIERKSGAGRGGGKRISLYGVERLRALILDLAVRGKLVPQNFDDEPASALLKDIYDEKARKAKAGEIGKRVEIPDLTEHEQPFALPSSWSWSRVGSLGWTQTGTTPPKDKLYQDSLIRTPEPSCATRST